MSAKTPPVFLSTQKTPLSQAVAARLRTIDREAWDHVLVVLPTIEAGRRVVDALLGEKEFVFPPKFATPLTLVPFGEGDGVATATQATMAWHTVLSTTTDCPLTFGGHSGTKLAPSFVTLTRDLAAGGYTIPTAAKILSGRDPRWDEWRGLWKSYAALLKSVGLRCPAEAQLAAAADFSPPAGITKVLVAGVADLPALAQKAIENCDAEILIHTPGGERGAYDEWGRARPEFWARAGLPVVESQIRVLSQPVDLGSAVAAIRPADRMAVFSGDAGLSEDLVCALEEEGRTGFLPEGNPLNRHPINRLATLLARLPLDGSWEHLEALVFHPDLAEWLGPLLPREAHGDWNRAGALTFCPGLKEILPRLRQERAGDDEPERRRILETLSPLVEKLMDIGHSLSSPMAAPALRKLLQEIYGPKDLGQRGGDKETLKAVLTLLEEIAAFPALAKMDAAALLTLLEALPGTWTPQREPGAIEIQGWLEIAGEDAPVIVLAGLNEGLLPTKRKTDALVPDAARAALGLDDSVSRHARDTAILHAALSVRNPENIHILSLTQTADGSPLKPSRLLLHVPDAQLAARIAHLVGTTAQAHTEHPRRTFATEPLRIPRVENPARSLRVTAFKAHLSCPLRFYLANRLGLSAPKTGAPLLGADVFGTWIHDVLKNWGNDPVLAASQSADEIRSWLLPRWDALFKGLEGDVMLMLQRESGRLRLEEFATAQAALRSEGWTTALVEWKFSDVKLPGWPLALSGRIDRVDVRDGAMLLIDYKTGGGDKQKNPTRAAHLRKARQPGRFGIKPDYAFLGNDVWRDLQLPLYALAIAREKPVAIPDDIRLGYFLIADDVRETRLCEWADADLVSAERCGRGIAEEVAGDAVLDWIAAGDFSRFEVHPRRDDFEALALSRFIEEGALTV